MCGCGCRNPARSSIERIRSKKPENHAGCCSQGCVLEDSPLGQWEKEHGCLVTKVEMIDNQQVVTKIPDPTFTNCRCAPKPAPRKERCCGLRYKVPR